MHLMIHMFDCAVDAPSIDARRVSQQSVMSQQPGVDNDDVEYMRRLPRKIPMKIEPRSFLGNERTFLAWAHMAVAFGGTSAALTSLCMNRSDIDYQGPISPQTVEQLGMVLIPASLLILGYGLFLFLHRNMAMNRKTVIMYDDRFGIVVLVSMISCMLLGMTFVAFYSFFTR
jgi:uncharacterized membrane protein YidH (DUF202 family)